jgi:histidinol-phosphate/aromatic aminotransferase/cobyric acid decarboxylase-like protein
MSDYVQSLARFNRRKFIHYAGLTAAAAAAALPFSEHAVAQVTLPKPRRTPAPGAVMLNLNENPMGPAPEALEAAYASCRLGGRYQDTQHAALQHKFADLEGLKPEYIKAFPGTTETIIQLALAFSSPDRPYVQADPTFEVGGAAAKAAGAKVIKVPLTKTYAHDVRGMVAAAPNAGIFYIASPNNPTGTATPLEDIKWLLANKPKGSVVALDEAYLHIQKNPQPATSLVLADQDIIILRTFSKIYGIAGLRAGAAFGRPDLLQKIAIYNAPQLPAPGMAAAVASLGIKGLVEDRRKTIIDIREDVFDFLSKNNTPFVPSDANHFMMDVKRPGEQVIDGLEDQNVFIGRVWPIWPTYVRVTVGTTDEMKKFKTAYLKVNT